MVALVASASALLVLPTATTSGQASIPLIAVDANIEGNGPRTVASIESCTSTSVGQPTDVDVVIPAPGVPADSGIAGYQFNLLYDPEVVWVEADGGDMLLAQAAGSSTFAIADPKPDSNGLYLSWGADFGPSGIEPAGSSETGPGVVARLTLTPQAVGTSFLTLSDVLVIDDEVERIELGEVRRASIQVGGSCPGEENEPIPAPAESPAAPSSSNPSEPATGGPEPPAADQPTEAAPATDPSSGVPAEGIPTAGGAPPLEGARHGWPIAAGAAMAGIGAAIVALALRTGRRRTARESSLLGGRQ